MTFRVERCRWSIKTFSMRKKLSFSGPKKQGLIFHPCEPHEGYTYKGLALYKQASQADNPKKISELLMGVSYSFCDVFFIDTQANFFLYFPCKKGLVIMCVNH